MAHANRVDAEIVHLTEVDFPFGSGPPLRVISRTDQIAAPQYVAALACGSGMALLRAKSLHRASNKIESGNSCKLGESPSVHGFPFPERLFES